MSIGIVIILWFLIYCAGMGATAAWCNYKYLNDWNEDVETTFLVLFWIVIPFALLLFLPFHIGERIANFIIKLITKRRR